MDVLRTRSGPEGSSLKLDIHVRWSFLYNKTMKDDRYFLDLAFEEAKKAKANNEVPVGAVLVKDNEVVASSFNTVEKDNDITSHAEMNVLKEAFKKLGTKNLKGLKLYVTLEPCLMCLGALVNAHIKDICFGAIDDFKGAFTHYNIDSSEFNLIYLKNKEYEAYLKDFFKDKR